MFGSIGTILVEAFADPMQKYRILIHAENLLAEIDGECQRLGFYTNVFIEASSAKDAAERAINFLREDAAVRNMQRNAPDDPIRLSVQKTEELDSFDGRPLPRTGLALYPLDASE